MYHRSNKSFQLLGKIGCEPSAFDSPFYLPRNQIQLDAAPDRSTSGWSGLDSSTGCSFHSSDGDGYNPSVLAILVHVDRLEK